MSLFGLVKVPVKTRVPDCICCGSNEGLIRHKCEQCQATGFCSRCVNYCAIRRGQVPTVTSVLGHVHEFSVGILSRIFSSPNEILENSPSRVQKNKQKRNYYNLSSVCRLCFRGIFSQRISFKRNSEIVYPTTSKGEMEPVALMVFIHDAGWCRKMYRWIAMHLSQNGVKSLLIDLPGHGGRMDVELTLENAINAIKESTDIFINNLKEKGEGRASISLSPFTISSPSSYKNYAGDGGIVKNCSYNDLSKSANGISTCGATHDDPIIFYDKEKEHTTVNKKPLILFGGIFGGMVGLEFVKKYPTYFDAAVVVGSENINQTRQWLVSHQTMSSKAIAAEIINELQYAENATLDIGDFHENCLDCGTYFQKIKNQISVLDKCDPISAIKAFKKPILFLDWFNSSSPSSSVRSFIHNIGDKCGSSEGVAVCSNSSDDNKFKNFKNNNSNNIKDLIDIKARRSFVTFAVDAEEQNSSKRFSTVPSFEFEKKNRYQDQTSVDDNEDESQLYLDSNRFFNNNKEENEEDRCDDFSDRSITGKEEDKFDKADKTVIQKATITRSIKYYEGNSFFTHNNEYKSLVVKDVAAFIRDVIKRPNRPTHPMWTIRQPRKIEENDDKLAYTFVALLSPT